MIALVISYTNSYKSGLSLLLLPFFLISILTMAEICDYAAVDVEERMGIFLDRDVLRSCSISYDIKVFGHVLLHTGHVLRNDCTLISNPEGVYMLSAVSHHSAWWPLVGLLVDPFRASGIQASSLQGSSNLQMFYPLPHQALLLLTGIWSKGAGPWPLNQHLNLFSSLFPVCRWLL